MNRYFDLFDELNELLEGAADKDTSLDMEQANRILGEMEKRANTMPKLKEQIKDVDFYRRTIESLFKPGSDSGPKRSFADQCRQERQGLEDFAKQHGLL